MTQATGKVETKPAVWPGAFGIYQQSKAAVMKNLALIVGLVIVNAAFTGTISHISRHHHGNALSLGWALNLLIVTFFTTALAVVVLSSIDSKKISFGQVISDTGNLYWEMLLLMVLLWIILLASFIALIVPFFIILPRVALAPYYVVDKNMGAIDALKASWNDSMGHSAKVWGVIGVMLLFAVLCFVLVGIYLTIVYSASLAILYRHLVKNKTNAAA